MRGLEYPHQLEITRRRRARAPGARSAATTTSRRLERQSDDDGRRRRRAAHGARAGEGRAARRRASRSSRRRTRYNPRRLQPFIRSSHDTLDYVRPSAHRHVHRSPARSTRPAPGDTPSRREIFICRPGDGRGDEAACARQILATLARRAYRGAVTRRRPASAARLLRARPRRRRARSTRGIETALQRMLASPKFLFRVERDPAERRAGRGRTASATSSSRRGCRSSSGAASRTTSCSSVAAQGKLHDAGGARAAGAAHARATRSRDALVDNFAGQWL